VGGTPLHGLVDLLVLPLRYAPHPQLHKDKKDITPPLFSIQKKFFISIYLRYIFLVRQGNRLYILIGKERTLRA
jgi:hypothetical protein